MKNNKDINVIIGYIKVPAKYLELDPEQRNNIIDKIITEVYNAVDKRLKPEYNRMDFIKEVFESTLNNNLKEENYEMCQLISDCQKKLDEH